MEWTIDFPSNLMVVGYNAENADMDRPRGEIIEDRFYVRATGAKGNRRVWTGGFVSAISAERAYVAFAPPVEFWDEARPDGSEAYAAEAELWEAEEIERERESELFLSPFPRY